MCSSARTPLCLQVAFGVAHAIRHWLLATSATMLLAQLVSCVRH